jgi:ABC-type bacteriocin/lantibiotic exporter with double-glycine peptidase domain
MGRMLNSIVAVGSQEHTIIAIFVMIILFSFISFFIGCASDWIGVRTFIHAERNLRTDLWHRLHRSPLSTLEKATSGEWLYRLTGDVSLLCILGNNTLRGGIGFFVVSLGTLTAIVATVPLLCITFLALVATSAFLYARINRRVRFVARRQRESQYRLNSSIVDLLEISTLLKIFGASSNYEAAINDTTKRLEKSKLIFMYIHNRFSWSIRFEILVAQMFVIGTCTWLCIRGGLKLGEIVAFDMLFTQMASQLTQFMYMLPDFDTGRECLASMRALLSLDQPQNIGALVSTSLSRSIELREVTFSYDQGMKPVIHRFSASIHPNEYVSFLGRNGSGKTTLLKLLLGVCEPTQGEILINRSGITYVPQRVIITRDSLLENIRLKDCSISEERVKEVISMCGLQDIVERCPKGLASIVQQSQFSGGEIQCIGIARALVRNPSILIIDEVANNLDIVSKERINKILEKSKQNCTIISVTHDFSNLENTDRIFLFTQTGIVEIMAASSDMRMRLALERIRE